MDTIYLGDLEEDTPVFAKKAGKLVGMVVLEYQAQYPKGWILRTGGELGDYGHSDTLQQCVQKGINMGNEFFIEE